MAIGLVSSSIRGNADLVRGLLRSGLVLPTGVAVARTGGSGSSNTIETECESPKRFGLGLD